MSDYPTVTINFKGVTPAIGMGLAVLDTGFYEGTICDVKHFADEQGGGPGRLAVYLDTPKGRVRESFDLGKGQAFLLALLVSCGVMKASPNKEVVVNWAKVIGKVAFFHYTRPAGEGMYPKIKFFTESEWNKERTRGAKQEPEKQAEAKQEPEKQAEAKQEPEKQAEAKTGGDDWDFLNE